MRARFIRHCFVLMLVLAASWAATAQDAARIYVEPTGWALGFNLGKSELWGDVGTKSPIEHFRNSNAFQRVTFMGGIFGRYTIHPCLAGRVNLNFGALYATDEWNLDLAKKAKTQMEDGYQRYARNQNARTYVLEASLMMEWLPFRGNPESKWANKKGQPYIGAGVGYFWFKPYSTPGTSNKFVSIYNLHVEGDGFGDAYPKAYSVFQPCVPLAIGYRFDVGEHVNIGAEFMYRKTFTDYLDGVSGKYIDPAVYAQHLSAQEAATAQAVADKSWQKNLSSPANPGDMRGDPTNKDGYSTLSITFYYKIPTRTGRWWKMF